MLYEVFISLFYSLIFLTVGVDGLKGDAGDDALDGIPGAPGE